jgi:hypothetical protein
MQVYEAMQGFWRVWLAQNPTPSMNKRASQLLGALERELADSDLVAGMRYITSVVAPEGPSR